MHPFLTGLGPIYPEIILAIGAMVLLMYGVFRPETEATAEAAGWLAVLILVIAALTVAVDPPAPVALFEAHSSPTASPISPSCW